MTTSQVDPQAVARDYLAVWNDDDPATRLNRLETSWSADATWTL